MIKTRFPMPALASLAIFLAIDISLLLLVIFEVMNLWLGAILHIGFMVGAVFSLLKALGQQAKKAINSIFLGFMMGFAIMLPVIGLIGVFVFAYHSEFMNPDERHKIIVDELLDISEGIDVDHTIEEDKNFRALLKHQTPEEYLQLILSTRYMQEKNAIPILKFALNTDIENVRLLAQALLDTKENDINQSIDEKVAMTQKPQHMKNSRLYLEIAQLYWKLADLGLAKDAMLRHVLAQLEKNTNIVMVLEPNDPISYYLSGKGHWLGKNVKNARQRFKYSLELGMPESKIRPYLREIMFYQNALRLRANKSQEEYIL